MFDNLNHPPNQQEKNEHQSQFKFALEMIWKRRKLYENLLRNRKKSLIEIYDIIQQNENEEIENKLRDDRQHSFIKKSKERDDRSKRLFDGIMTTVGKFGAHTFDKEPDKNEDIDFEKKYQKEVKGMKTFAQATLEKELRAVNKI